MMSERYFDGLESQLREAKRRLAPPRHGRLSRLLRPGVALSGAVVLVSVAAFAATQ
jgi:hypothetical protein